MAERSTAFKIQTTADPSPSLTADQLIASLGGDARAAVIQLVAIVGAFERESETLAASASRGYARLAIRRDG